MLNYIEIEASEQQAKHATPSLASVEGVFFTELFGPYFKLADSLIKSSQAGNYQGSPTKQSSYQGLREYLICCLVGWMVASGGGGAQPKHIPSTECVQC